MVVSLGQLVQTAVSIPNAAALSAAIPTSGLSLCGIQLPAALTGTALTFQVATTLGGTYQDLYNSAGLVSYTVAASRYIAINPADFQGALFIKVKSNATEGAARALTLSLKGI